MIPKKNHYYLLHDTVYGKMVGKYVDDWGVGYKFRYAFEILKSYDIDIKIEASVPRGFRNDEIKKELTKGELLSKLL